MPIRRRCAELLPVAIHVVLLADVILQLTPRAPTRSTSFILYVVVAVVVVVVVVGVFNNMFTRFRVRPFVHPTRLVLRVAKLHPQHTSTSLVLRTRGWSSSSTRKQQDKDADNNGENKQKHNSSDGATPSLFKRVRTFAKWTALLGASSAAGVILLGSAIFLHDAFTYTERHVDRVPVNPLALHPETGGPKNLPVAKVLVSDEEDEENRKLAQKPRLVIVGGGWGVRVLLTVPLELCAD